MRILQERREGARGRADRFSAFIVMDKIRVVWYDMRHETQTMYTHQRSGSFGAAACEIPSQGLCLLQGRHDEIRRSAEVPHLRDHRRALVQAFRRSRRGCSPRRQAWAEARRGEAQALRRADERAEEGRHRQDARPVEVRFRPLVFEGDQRVCAVRIRHVNLPQDSASAYAEDWALPTSVP